MKKQLMLSILALALLCACASPAAAAPEDAPAPQVSTAPETTREPTPEPTPGGFRFTRENFPSLNGSTAAVPLAEAVCMELLGETRGEVSDLVRFTRTTHSYYSLMNGLTELLIVGECNDEVLAEKERLGFEWEKTPFATDAFVFVVNEDNPVDSISVDEARRIYTGEITNWSELGGEDREIIPFQRNQGAGSQTLMEKLVMRGEPMMEAPTGFVADSMGRLMEVVKSCDGSPGAIGYSVYYYAEEMKMAQGLKLLALEGVEPEPDTIRSGAYPLTAPYYVVIPAGTPDGSAVRELYDYLLSEPGQRLAAREGYVSVMDLGVSAGAGAEPVLEVGTRFYEQYTDRLIPSPDYGRLIPYAGVRIPTDNPYEDGSLLYGLMTRDGAVVADPVYSSVGAPGYYGSDGVMHQHPLLLLYLGDAGSQSGSDSLLAVAAADGSWCTDFIYRKCTSSADGLVLVGDEGMTLMSPDGGIELELSFEDMNISVAERHEMLSHISWGEGMYATRCGDYIVTAVIEKGDGAYYRCYNISTGGFTDMLMYEFWDMDRKPTVYFDEYVDSVIPDAIVRPDFLLGWDAPYLLEVCEHNGNVDSYTYYNSGGTLLPELSCTFYGYYDYPFTSLWGGLVQQLETNCASYYDLETGECVFRTGLHYQAD